MRRQSRLRGSADFERTLAGGRRVKATFFTLYVRDNESGVARVGLAVSRRIGGAVVRNRIKRRLRALARPLAEGSQAGKDVVIVARSAAIEAGADSLRQEMNEVWRKAVEGA